VLPELASHPDEVRESLAYWERRRREARWWQRGRRREAQRQVDRCERELVAAERAHRGPLTPRRAMALAGVRPSAVRRRAKQAAVVAGAGTAAAGYAAFELLRAVLGG
jgi:hypothetical protein